MIKDIENKHGAVHSTFDDAFEATGHGRYNYLVLLACCIINMAASMDLFGFSVVVAATNCDLNLTISQMGLLASSPFSGLIFAYPWGYFADTKGRKPALILSATGGFVCATLSSLSTRWEVLMVSKIIGSCFSMASFMLTITYLGENIGFKKRKQFIFILNSMNLASESVSFGLAYLILPLSVNLYLPWMTTIFRSWRLLVLAMAAPLGIGALMMLLLNESPKFLADQGEEVKCLEILKNIFAANGGKREDFSVKRLECTVAKDEKVSLPTMLWRHASPIFKPPLLWTTLQLFYVFALAQAICNIYIMWLPTLLDFVFKSISNSSDDLGFCYSIQNATSRVNVDPDVPCREIVSEEAIVSGFFISLILAILNLSVSKFAARRRLILMLIFLISAFSCIMVSVLKQPIASVIFYTLIQSTSVSVGSVVSFFVDLYPTSCRGLATSLGFMVGRFSALTGTALVGLIIRTHCHLLFYVTAVLLLSGILVALLLPADKKK
ncbi:unnamed protein product [Leptosia nina]|uniref:Major facilitator superfamily (MFS) profile domain-containing protein n=1 Tax=Leptosia nina TaxID=320188 RepID=A0AAV1J320_9NEOP